MFFYNESDSEVSQVQPGTSDPYFSNVSLLLPMDSDFSDSSNNSLTVNLNGNTTISTTESKYGGGSGYFDGSSHAHIPANTAYAMNSQDFAIEFWYNPVSFGSHPGALTNYANTWTTNRWAIHAPHAGFGSGFSFFVYNYSYNSPILQQTSALQAGVWTHLALVREGNTWMMFVNGVLESYRVSSVSLDGGIGGDGLYIGANFVNGLQRYANAYIDDLRITKGVARYTTANFTPPEAHTTTEQHYNNVSLLLSLDSDFSDSSINNINVTTAGNATISSTESKYGGASAYLDGSGDGIVVTDNNFANFGTDDFTIETWINMASDSAQGTIFEARSAQAYELVWYIDPATNKLGFIPNNHGVTRLTSVGTISRDTWHHLVVSRENGTVSFFIDGVKDAATAYYPNSLYQTRTDVRIGQLVDTGFTSGFKGYFDDFRVTKGVARYTANFTPPTEAHPTS